MPTTVLVERRNWFRLPVSLPASFRCGSDHRIVDGNILNLSETGIGFTADENLQSLDELSVSFWLPFDAQRPNDASLQPVIVRLSIVSSRYAASFETYAYSAMFVGLESSMRLDIRAHIEHVDAAGLHAPG